MSPMESSSDMPSVDIDVVADVVCPWCYIGKRRLEEAIALTPGVHVSINWRPYFLNPWIPREGIDRQTYLETKFGSVERYAAIAERIASAAALEGLVYNPDKISRQPNTLDCHRLILWASMRITAAHRRCRPVRPSTGRETAGSWRGGRKAASLFAGTFSPCYHPSSQVGAP
jgi:predicted DsbA family dithiol-disulfide isomerase